MVQTSLCKLEPIQDEVKKYRLSFIYSTAHEQIRRNAHAKRGGAAELTTSDLYLSPPVSPFRVCACILLPHPRLKEQVALALQAQARLHEHLERTPLAAERIDDVRAGLDERRLEHVAEQAEDGIQGCKRGGGRVGRGGRGLAVLDACEELREECEVED